MESPLYLGIDFGTSGARAFVIDHHGEIQARSQIPFPSHLPKSLTQLWQDTLTDLILSLPTEQRQQLAAIAINGTSSTVLLCDRNGSPITDPLLYNDNRGVRYLESLQIWVPPNHSVLSATSSLAKLWWWRQELDWHDVGYLFHQADWLALQLHGTLGISDYHNSLKLGYDVEALAYPDWLLNSEFAHILPHVVAPGTKIAPLLPDVCDRYKIPETCIMCAGTTDSIAAFLASGAQSPGEAVTSLGSTLVLKLLSTSRVQDLGSGVYSHRLGDRWLVGGASNTGGAVLTEFFDPDELTRLSALIPVEQPSPYHYYPLVRPGERFPINNPNLQPQLDPRPDDPIAFLHGLLESMARIEAQGYTCLKALGATPLTTLYTAGGGAQNSAWTAIRQRYVSVPLRSPLNTEAAYGTARLAQEGLARYAVKKSSD
jgi:D-ribulokinase